LVGKAKNTLEFGYICDPIVGGGGGPNKKNI
jgi:hypothetical protein